MGKTRIIVTCPVTDIVVITGLTYDEVVKPRRDPLLFACPCGETHQLRFGGVHGHRPPPHQAPTGSRQGVR
jgi:hypothetical protein